MFEKVCWQTMEANPNMEGGIVKEVTDDGVDIILPGVGGSESGTVVKNVPVMGDPRLYSNNDPVMKCHEGRNLQLPFIISGDPRIHGQETLIEIPVIIIFPGWFNYRSKRAASDAMGLTEKVEKATYLEVTTVLASGAFDATRYMAVRILGQSPRWDAIGFEWVDGVYDEVNNAFIYTSAGAYGGRRKFGAAGATNGRVDYSVMADAAGFILLNEGNFLAGDFGWVMNDGESTVVPLISNQGMVVPYGGIFIRNTPEPRKIFMLLAKRADGEILPRLAKVDRDTGELESVVDLPYKDPSFLWAEQGMWVTASSPDWPPGTEHHQGDHIPGILHPDLGDISFRPQTFTYQEPATIDIQPGVGVVLDGAFRIYSTSWPLATRRNGGQAFIYNGGPTELNYSRSSGWVDPLVQEHELRRVGPAEFGQVGFCLRETPDHDFKQVCYFKHWMCWPDIHIPAYFGAAQLVAFDYEGEVVWEKLGWDPVTIPSNVEGDDIVQTFTPVAAGPDFFVLARLTYAFKNGEWTHTSIDVDEGESHFRTFSWRCATREILEFQVVNLDGSIRGDTKEFTPRLSLDQENFLGDGFQDPDENIAVGAPTGSWTTTHEDDQPTLYEPGGFIDVAVEQSVPTLFHPMRCAVTPSGNRIVFGPRDEVAIRSDAIQRPYRRWEEDTLVTADYLDEDDTYHPRNAHITCFDNELEEKWTYTFQPFDMAEYDPESPAPPSALGGFAFSNLVVTNTRVFVRLTVETYPGLSLTWRTFLIALDLQTGDEAFIIEFENVNGQIGGFESEGWGRYSLWMDTAGSLYTISGLNTLVKLT